MSSRPPLPRCPECGGALPAGCAPLLCPACALDPRAGVGDGGPNEEQAAHADAESGAKRDSAAGRLGGYALRRELARGGMGVVYEAWQESLRRLVAVKVLPGTAFASAEQRARFQREAEAVARLRHPGIVAIHEVGEQRGQPFLVMDLVAGGSLADRLAREGHLPPREAAGLLREVALAVAHAHARGVVHRDLKPSNILLTPEARPVLADFGLARFAEEQAGVTQGVSALALGTPSYLPPERCGAAATMPTPAEDIYGLGAVLYHCLTGRPPFVADSLTALLAATSAADPVAPTTLNPSVSRDLETVCLRCLEKAPGARYADAEQLADELRRYLDGEPVRARPLGRVRRLLRAARRRPVLAALSAALVVAVLGGTTATTLGWRAARRGEALARAETERRLDELYSSKLAAASAGLLASGDPAPAREALEATRPTAGGRDRRGIEWYALKNLLRPRELAAVRAHGHIVTALAWSPDGRSLLSGAHDGSLKLWSWRGETEASGARESARLEPVETLAEAGGQRIHQLAWCAAGGAYLRATGGEVSLRVLGEAAPHWVIPGERFAFSARSGRLVTAGGGPFYYQAPGALRLWRWSGNETETPTGGEVLASAARALALSADGRWLAWAEAGRAQADDERDVWLLDLTRGERTPRRLATGGPVWAMAFSPDGAELAVTRFHGGAEVLRFRVEDGASLSPVAGHGLRVWTLAYAPDGRSLFTASSDRSIRAWARDGEAVVAERALGFAHDDEIWALTPNPAGPWLASGDKAGGLKVFARPLPVSAGEQAARYPHYRYTRPEFSVDGRTLSTVVAAGADGAGGAGDGLWRRPVHGGAAVAERVEGGATREWAGRDSAGADWYWSRWERRLRRGVGGGAGEKSWPLPATRGAVGEPWRVGSLGGGDYFYVLEDNGDFQRLNVRDGSVRRADGLVAGDGSGGNPLIASAAVLSPDGRYALAATWRELALHDFVSGQTRRFPNGRHWARDAAFSPDGRLLATAGIDGRIVLRSLPEGRIEGELRGHLEEASGVAFAPDGRTLVSVEIGHGLRFWRLDTRREVLFLALPEATETVAVSPDGRAVAVTTCPPGAPPEAGEVRVLTFPGE